MGSPAQPLFDWRDKYIVHPMQALENFGNHPLQSIMQATGMQKPAEQMQVIKPPDTSWHDQMVRQANASALAQQQAETAAPAKGALRQQMKKGK